MAETPTPVRPKAVRKPLDTTDRCDKGKCDSQAYVRVFITEASWLLFCGHHWTHTDKVKLDKYEIEDKTELIDRDRHKQ